MLNRDSYRPSFKLLISMLYIFAIIFALSNLLWSNPLSGNIFTSNPVQPHVNQGNEFKKVNEPDKVNAPDKVNVLTQATSEISKDFWDSEESKTGDALSKNTIKKISLSNSSKYTITEVHSDAKITHPPIMQSEDFKDPANTFSNYTSSNHHKVYMIGERGKVELRGPVTFPDLSQHSDDQKKVVEAMRWAWKGYRENAFGSDVLNVNTWKGGVWNGYDLGLTLVDSLDTLYLMGLKEDFNEAVKWVEENLQEKFKRSDLVVNLFETTIRLLGSLLATYHFTNRDRLLEIATDLGNRLLVAFEKSSSGIPYSDVNLGLGTALAPHWGDSSLSEVSTVQLEFKYLSKLTGDSKYADYSDVVMDKIEEMVQKKYKDGILPIFVNAQHGEFRGSTITLGARGDSYYEYLLKQWLISGRTDKKYEERYIHAVKGIMDKLVKSSSPSGLVFIGEMISGHFSAKMDHLVCFMPGLLALGHANGMPESHMKLAEGLMYTCYQMYSRMKSGLAPEIVFFEANRDFIVKPSDDFNILRPETVESLFIMHQLTGDKKYQEWGREIFNAFEKHSKLPNGGYRSVRGVSIGQTSPFRTEMESFFLAETLKYLFLLFSDSDSYIPLDKYVFNTEAHPLPAW